MFLFCGKKCFLQPSIVFSGSFALHVSISTTHSYHWRCRQLRMAKRLEDVKLLTTAEEPGKLPTTGKRRSWNYRNVCFSISVFYIIKLSNFFHTIFFWKWHTLYTVTLLYLLLSKKYHVPPKVCDLCLRCIRKYTC